MLQKISENLYLFEDTCNVYIVKEDSRALLIDFGSGKVLKHLNEIGIASVDWILHTHHHRDQCQGDGMVDAGAQSDESEAGGELPGSAGESRDRSSSGGQEEESHQQRLLAIAVAQPAGGYGADAEEHQADRGQRGQLLGAQAIEGAPDFRLDCREEMDVDMRHRVSNAREEQDVALNLLVAIHLFDQNFSR